MSADLNYVQTILLQRDPADPASHADSIAAVATASVLSYLYALESGRDMSIWWSWNREGQAKTVRRAKPSVFERLTVDAPSTFCVGKACAAVWEPCTPADVPAALTRLQVSGTELPRTAPTVNYGSGATIVLNGGLGMSTGKACAQAAHALLDWARREARLENGVPVISNRLHSWAMEGYNVAVHETDTAGFVKFQGGRTPHTLIHDHGHTEIAPGSATAFVLGC